MKDFKGLGFRVLFWTIKGLKLWGRPTLGEGAHHRSADSSGGGRMGLGFKAQAPAKASSMHKRVSENTPPPPLRITPDPQVPDTAKPEI